MNVAPLSPMERKRMNMSVELSPGQLTKAAQFDPNQDISHIAEPHDIETSGSVEDDNPLSTD